MEHIRLLFCEGPHDLAILRHVLRARCEFEKSSRTYNELPEPLSSFLLKHLQGDVPGHVQVGDPARRPSFSEVFIRQVNDHKRWIFVFTCGKPLAPNETTLPSFITELRKVIQSPLRPKQPQAQPRTWSTRCSLAFVFDADEEGTSKTILKLKNLLGLPGSPVSFSASG